MAIVYERGRKVMIREYGCEDREATCCEVIYYGSPRSLTINNDSGGWREGEPMYEHYRIRHGL